MSKCKTYSIKWEEQFGWLKKAKSQTVQYADYVIKRLELMEVV